MHTTWQSSSNNYWLIIFLPLNIATGNKHVVGASEQRNGFQMWRRLFEDNRGSGDMVEFAGIEVLREYKPCTKISEVSAHMDPSL